MLTAALTSIPGSASRETSSSTRVAANAVKGESKTLPPSGWHATGDAPSVYMRAAATQTAHPQPMESPGETVLR